MQYFRCIHCGAQQKPDELEDIHNQIAKPINPHPTVDPVDTYYFWFFLRAMPRIVTISLPLPTVCEDLFRYVENESARSSFLSIAAFIADHQLGRSMDRSLINYIRTIQTVQLAIQKNQIDEGLVVALIFLSTIDALRFRSRTCRNHLRGLRIMFDLLRGSGNPPMMVVCRRVAIRLDCWTSFHLFEEPVFPVTTTKERLETELWIGTICPYVEGGDWALVAFGIDDLIHKASHYAIRIHELRTKLTNNLQPKISSVVASLRAEVDIWRKSPLLSRSEQLEQMMTQFDKPVSKGFLHYPPVNFYNPRYLGLIMNYHALSIYLAFLLEPEVGLSFDLQRFKSGVEVCRILAAFEAQEIQPTFGWTKLWAMFLAQAAFGKRGPQETAWLSERLGQVEKWLPLDGADIGIFAHLSMYKGNFWDKLAETRPPADAG